MGSNKMQARYRRSDDARFRRSHSTSAARWQSCVEMSAGRSREGACSTTIQVFSGRFRIGMPSSNCSGSLALCRAERLKSVSDRFASESDVRATAFESLSEVCFCNRHVRSRSRDGIIKLTAPVVLCRLSGLAHRTDVLLDLR